MNALDPLLDDLATLLRCLACGGVVTASASALRCARCGREIPVVEGVPHIREAAEDPALERERQAVLEIEQQAPEVLPPDSTVFTLPALLAGPGPLRSAFLSLPYDDGSVFYRENEYFRNVATFASAFDDVVSRLGLPAGSRVLDVGADLTWSTARLARRGWRPVGIDINHHLVASRVFHEHGIHYGVVNVDMHLPAFADGAFDGITAFNALHHTHRLDPLIANLARMLKAGGVLGFVEPYWFHQSVRDAFGASQIEAGINENVHRLEEWHCTLVNHGFELRSMAAGHAFRGVYERVPAERRRRIAVADARDEIYLPYYASELEVPGEPALRAAPGAALAVPVRVRNRSTRTWSEVSQVPVHLSYHLYARSDHEAAPVLLQFDNARTGIGGDLPPDDARVVDLRVTAPDMPGRYVVEIDLVHEGLNWFSDRGQRPALVDLVVTAGRG